LSPCGPAANDSRTLFDDLAWLYGLGHRCRFERFLSDIQWDGDQSFPFTTGCFEFKLKVSPPTPWHCLAAVRAFTARREVPYHLNCDACWPASKLSKKLG